MLVHFEDQDYDFDIEAITLAEATTIHNMTGLTIKGTLNGLAELHPDALRALYWLMLKQNGKAVDMHKVGFAALKFGEAIGNAFDEEEKRKKAADPTEAPEAPPA